MNIATPIQSLFTLHGLASLVVLSLLELVLGIDNIIFISLVIAKLPENKRVGSRVVGLSLALVIRIFMLLGLVGLAQRTTTLFVLHGFAVSIHDVLFFVGGAYLIVNTVKELREHIKGKSLTKEASANSTFTSVILQIVMVDVLFSFDSIFTAIGLVQNFVIMSLAIVLGMIFMLIVSGKISAFINKNPGIKTLALGFIVAVGIMLVSSAFHFEIPKKYVYGIFFMAFALELGKIQVKKKA